MRSVFRIGTLLCVAASVCLAEAWSGKLVDAACMDQQSRNDTQEQKINTCPGTKSTTSFGIVTADGHSLRLDNTGNGKAAAAMKSATDDQPIQATVSGDIQGQVVTVETFSIQQ